MIELVDSSFIKLKMYCEKNSFQGWDPYDGLNSRFFQQLPIINRNKWARLAWIQLFKRSPFNFRKFLNVPKEPNPKALGLFITAYCNLYKTDPKDEYLEVLQKLVQKTLFLSSPGYSGACWGYNFDWQSRLTFTPKYFPTVVATSFVGTALLDAYELLDDRNIYDQVKTSADFILTDLVRKYDDQGNIGLSYAPAKDKLEKTPYIVFNATLLGSRLLAKIYQYNHDHSLKEMAKKAVQYCINHQNVDGSWYYGTHDTQQWIDSFHTGFNLQCLCEYAAYTHDQSYDGNIKKGLQFYLDNFFLTEGIPKYYHNATYPIDIHSPAQLIVTLYTLKEIDSNKKLVDNVVKWVIENMQDEEGYFYYQIKKNIKNKIPYMRWSQAWMLYAMSFYLLHFKTISRG